MLFTFIILLIGHYDPHLTENRKVRFREMKFLVSFKMELIIVLCLVRPYSLSGPHHYCEKYMKACIGKPFVRHLCSGHVVPNSGILFLRLT